MFIVHVHIFGGTNWATYAARSVVCVQTDIIIIDIPSAVTKSRTSQLRFAALTAHRSAEFLTATQNYLQTTGWDGIQRHQDRSKAWFVLVRCPAHVRGWREIRCGQVGVVPYQCLIMGSHHMEFERIFRWRKNVWLSTFEKQNMSCCVYGGCLWHFENFANKTLHR